MLTYLSDSIMLDMLKKVQELQPAILKAGYSAHIDATVHQNFLDAQNTHLSFELTVFEDNEIVKSFDFMSSDSEEVLNATYDLAVAYTKYLQAHV